MSELKGGVFAMAFFVGIIIPFLLMIGIDSLHQHAFLKTTEEMAELVKEEGGVSDHVKQVANNLSKRGYTVTFSKSGIVQFGEEVVIRYQYKYKNVRGTKNMDTKNKVVIHKRSGGRSADNNQGNNGGINNSPKSFAVTTPESLNAENEYTFAIPGLKSLQGVTSNTGAVEVIRVNGENVTVKVAKGTVTRTVQTGGKYIPADTKFVNFTTNISQEAQRIKDKATRDHGGILSGYFNDIDIETAPGEYKGTLTRTYIGVPTKEVTYDKLTGTTKIVYYQYQNGEWVEGGGSIGTAMAFDYKDEETYASFRTGTYTLGDIVSSVEYIDLDKPIVVDSRIQNKNPNSSAYRPVINPPKEGDYATVITYTKAYRFKGLAFLGGTSGAKWLYEGTMTRPETDTRTYDNYYQYKLSFEYLGA